MSKKKLVSIIVPVYNNEIFVGKCIESFLAQTYSDIEVILVNDGSTDNSLEICRSYAQRDGRIKIIDKKNEGVSIARNTGLDAAEGEYICFVDSDDYVAREYIEHLHDLLEKHQADCAMCDKLTELENGQPVDSVRTGEKVIVLDDDQIDFRDSSYLAVVIHKLYRAECLRPNGQWIRFDPELKIAEDSHFAALAVPHIRRIVKTDRQLYHYVRHGSNTTGNTRFSVRINELKSWYRILELGKTLGERYEYSAKYELVSRCFRVHRATRPSGRQERKISRQIVRYMRSNASYILCELEYPKNLKLVFVITLVFPWLTRGMNLKKR